MEQNNEAKMLPTGSMPITDVEPNYNHVQTLEQVEKTHILHVLEMVYGNKVKAAKILGVSVKTMYNKLHAYGLDTANNATQP